MIVTPGDVAGRIHTLCKIIGTRLQYMFGKLHDVIGVYLARDLKEHGIERLADSNLDPGNTYYFTLEIQEFNDRISAVPKFTNAADLRTISCFTIKDIMLTEETKEKLEDQVSEGENKDSEGKGSRQPPKAKGK